MLSLLRTAELTRFHQHFSKLLSLSSRRWSPHPLTSVRLCWPCVGRECSTLDIRLLSHICRWSRVHMGPRAANNLRVLPQPRDYHRAGCHWHPAYSFLVFEWSACFQFRMSKRLTVLSAGVRPLHVIPFTRWIIEGTTFRCEGILIANEVFVSTSYIAWACASWATLA